jgi:hypothetical protein
LSQISHKAAIKAILAILDIYTECIYNGFMSTVVWLDNGLKIKVNANDHNPPHVHVEGNGGKVRIRLDTFAEMNGTRGFGPRDVAKIKMAVRYYADQLWSKWNEYHGKEE